MRCLKDSDDLILFQHSFWRWEHAKNGILHDRLNERKMQKCTISSLEIHVLSSRCEVNATHASQGDTCREASNPLISINCSVAQTGYSMIVH